MNSLVLSVINPSFPSPCQPSLMSFSTIENYYSTVCKIVMDWELVWSCHIRKFFLYNFCCLFNFFNNLQWLVMWNVLWLAWSINAKTVNGLCTFCWCFNKFMFYLTKKCLKSCDPGLAENMAYSKEVCPNYFR